MVPAATLGGTATLDPGQVYEPRRYHRPGPFLRLVVNPLVARLGLVAVLAVRGRKSGEWREVPLNVLAYQGERYLVASRGETDWVRNLRAAGSGELRRGGRTEPFIATELEDAEKSPLLAAYMEHWGSRTRGQFAYPPVPRDHPVFRIEPVTRQR